MEATRHRMGNTLQIRRCFRHGSYGLHLLWLLLLARSAALSGSSAGETGSFFGLMTSPMYDVSSGIYLSLTCSVTQVCMDSLHRSHSQACAKQCRVSRL